MKLPGFQAKFQTNRNLEKLHAMAFRAQSLLLLLIVLLACPYLQTAHAQVTPPNCPGCEAFGDGDPNTFWACPQEINIKWTIVVTWTPPQSGLCNKPALVCMPKQACYFNNVTISLTNISGNKLDVQSEFGTNSGAPNTSSPPNGGVLTLGRKKSAASGETISYDFSDRTVACGYYYTCDISYQAGSCPTPTPQGWGSCSIVDVFLRCSACE